jgi:hypothetical protein
MPTFTTILTAAIISVLCYHFVFGFGGVGDLAAYILGVAGFVGVWAIFHRWKTMRLLRLMDAAGRIMEKHNDDPASRKL